MIVGKEIYSLSKLPKGVRRSLFSSLSILAVFVTFASFGAYGTLGAHPVHAGGSVNVWWPTNGAHMTGTQPFKALVQGLSADQYDMYWQVDGGTLVPMSTNTTDYPHKEASVDVTNWNWHGSGPYVVHFVAKQNGSVIADATENIYVDNGLPVQTSQPVVIMSTNAPAPTAPLATAPVQSQTQASAQPQLQSQPAPQPASQPSADLQVWWPTDGSTVSGLQPFKAVVSNLFSDQYDMYWQVDNGSLVPMSDNPTGGLHKEASVDVSNWNWHGSGPYAVTFVAKDKSGTIVAQKTVHITVAGGSAPAPQPQTSQPQTQALSAPVTLSAPLVSISGNDPLSGARLYVDSNSDASRQAQSWASSNPSGAQAMQVLAGQSTASWFGSWNSNVYNDVHNLITSAASKGEVPVMVVYDIPQRDCSGGYSAGGGTPDGYRSWISSMASAIGNNKAVVILEPDALADLSCLSSGDQATRLSLLSSAVSTLKSHPNTIVYLDAGHSGWVDPSTMASRLKQAGISQADGFATNVSNFDSNSSEEGYGDQVSQALGGKHYVIDTSRNGNGSNGQWCNPQGRAIGTRPTTQTGDSHVDAFLWLKTPGESDGNCNGGPSAGVWWPDYALQLVHNAGL